MADPLWRSPIVANLLLPTPCRTSGRIMWPHGWEFKITADVAVDNCGLYSILASCLLSTGFGRYSGTFSVTPTTIINPKNIAVQMERRTAMQTGRVPRYKWWGVLKVFPFAQGSGAPKAQAMQIGSVLQYDWRRIAVLFEELLVVGVSDILLNHSTASAIQKKGGSELPPVWMPDSKGG